MANVIDITDDGRKVYECDPDKNTECTKENCFINGGECSRTMKKEYAKETVTNGQKFCEVFGIDLVGSVYSSHDPGMVLFKKWLQMEYKLPQEV